MLVSDRSLEFHRSRYAVVQWKAFCVSDKISVFRRPRSHPRQGRFADYDLPQTDGPADTRTKSPDKQQTSEKSKEPQTSASVAAQRFLPAEDVPKKMLVSVYFDSETSDFAN